MLYHLYHRPIVLQIVRYDSYHHSPWSIMMWLSSLSLCWNCSSHVTWPWNLWLGGSYYYLPRQEEEEEEKKKKKTNLIGLLSTCGEKIWYWIILKFQICDFVVLFVPCDESMMRLQSWTVPSEVIKVHLFKLCTLSRNTSVEPMCLANIISLHLRCGSKLHFSIAGFLSR